MKRLFTPVTKRLFAPILMLATAGLAYAHNGMEHVMGTVAAMTVSSLQVKATTGRMTAVVVNASTHWMRGSDAITEKDVKIGDRVVVHARPVDGKLMAAEVAVAATPHAH